MSYDFYNESNRREAARLSNVLVKCSLNQDDSHLNQPYVPKDISAGGVCVIVDKKPNLNSAFPLSIELGEEIPPIQTKGRVVWTHEVKDLAEFQGKYYIGIRFIEIKEEDRKIIFNYVAARLKYA